MNGTDRSSADPWRFPAGTLRFAGSRGHNAQDESTDGSPSSPPAISLPIGGGTIQTMGEKFSVNSVSGNGLRGFLHRTRLARSGFGPRLALASDFGAGNGSFGWRWRLSVQSIDFTYSHEQDPADACNPVYTCLLAVTQTDFKRHNGGYPQRSRLPVEVRYTQPVVQDTRFARRRHTRHARRAGRGVILQAQPQPDERQIRHRSGAHQREVCVRRAGRCQTQPHPGRRAVPDLELEQPGYTEDVLTRSEQISQG
jgi:virulence plasmid B protein